MVAAFLQLVSLSMSVCCVQARDCIMSSMLLSEHSLMAFVLHQNKSGCVMLSVPPPAHPSQAAASLGTPGMTGNPL